MKKNKIRLIAGALALLLSCSTLFDAAVAVKAAETSGNVSAETFVQEAETTAEELPELEEVRESLDKSEVVAAEDLTLTAGGEFDAESDFTGMTFDKTKVKVSLKDASDENGQKFDANIPGTYQAVYHVEPLSGHPAYQIMRRIIVHAAEPETQSQQEQGGNGNTEDDGSGEDGEADPEPAIEAEAEEIIEEMMDTGVFLSVVPSATTVSRKNVTLEKGEDLYYPSDLGNYLTCKFYVNGKIAYCIESNKATPPSADMLPIFMNRT